MAVKLDFDKAYDWVEWTFLKGIMHKLGFDRRWVQLAMETHYLLTFFSYVLKAPQRCYIKQ